MFFHWLRPKPRRRSEYAPSSRRRFRPAIELLEDRLAPALFIVNSNLDTDDGLPFNPIGTTTLRKALRLANADDVVDEIKFKSTLNNKTILLTGGELAISKPVKITGLGADRLTIDASFASRIFNIDDGGSAVIDVTISRLRLTKGKADDGDPGTNTVADGGGAILNRESLNLAGMRMHLNVAARFGGAIDNLAFGTVNLVNSILSNNEALEVGGGIVNSLGGRVEAANTTFVDNMAGAGGAIHNNGDVLTLTNCHLFSNSANDSYGGAINSMQGSVTLQNVNISENSAFLRGGGIHIDAGELTLENCTVLRNFSLQRAGGIFTAAGANATVMFSTFSGNRANGADGGAIANGGGLFVGDSTFSENTAVFGGGAISNFDDGSLVVLTSTLSSNSANSGGGIANNGTVSVFNSTISSNQATGSGGGILNFDTLELTNCTIVLNHASEASSDGGGGLRSISSAPPTLRNTIVAGNLMGVGSDSDDIAGVVNPASNFNLIGDPNSAGGLSNEVNGNIVGKFFGSFQLNRPLVEFLDPILRNNGGRTYTHALVPGGAAHQSGGNEEVNGNFDQRGNPRIAGSRVDIGAYELSDPLFADLFNRADGILGTPWRTQVGALRVVSGRAQGTGTASVHLATLAKFTRADVDMHLFVDLSANQSAGIVARYTGLGDKNYYAAILQSDSAGVVTARLLRNVNGVVTELAVANNQVASGVLRFRVVGSRLDLWLNDILLGSVEDTKLKTGSAGIRTIGTTAVDNFQAFPAMADLGNFDGFNRPNNVVLSEPWAQKVGTLHTADHQTRGTQPINVAVLNAVNAADVDLQATFVFPFVNNSAGLLARYQGSGDTNYYLAKLTRTTGGFTARIIKNVGGLTTVLASTTIASSSPVADVRFVVAGINPRLFVNGIEVANVLDGSLARGSVGLRTDQFARIDNFRSAAVTTELPFKDLFDLPDESALNSNWTRRAGSFTFSGFQLTAGNAPVNLATLAGLNVANVTLRSSVVPTREIGLVACYSGRGDANYYMARIQKVAAGFRLSIVRNFVGWMTTLKAVNVPNLTGEIEFTVEGNRLELRMNDELQATAFDNYLAGGSIGIRSAAGERLPDFNATLVKSLPFNDTFPTIKLSQSWVQRRGRFQAGPVGIPDKTQGTAALNFATVGRLSLADVDVEANVDVPAITGRFASLVARCSGPGQLNMYHATVFFNGEKFEARISKTVGGVTTLLASVEIGSGSGMLRFLVVGTKLTLFFGGAEVLSAFDFSLTSGGVGIRSSVDSTFDNFRVSSPGS